jgi:enamine deaminase RidA (YjgF/YER057c/UK114 family)
MCADSNTVCRSVEEPIHLSEKGKEMKMTMLSRPARVLLWMFAIALSIGVSVQQGNSQERKTVNLSPARGLPFSDGVVVGNTLYIAGQEGTDESNKLVAG